MPGAARQLGLLRCAPLEKGQGVLDAIEVDEVASQVMTVRGGVLFEDGDSLLGASGAA